jgi:hypothetical protein
MQLTVLLLLCFLSVTLLNALSFIRHYAVLFTILVLANQKTNEKYKTSHKQNSMPGEIKTISSFCPVLIKRVQFFVR